MPASSRYQDNFAAASNTSKQAGRTPNVSRVVAEVHGEASLSTGGALDCVAEVAAVAVIRKAGQQQEQAQTLRAISADGRSLAPRRLPVRSARSPPAPSDKHDTGQPVIRRWRSCRADQLSISTVSTASSDHADAEAPPGGKQATARQGRTWVTKQSAEGNATVQGKVVPKSAQLLQVARPPGERTCAQGQQQPQHSEASKKRKSSAKARKANDPVQREMLQRCPSRGREDHTTGNALPESAPPRGPASGAGKGKGSTGSARSRVTESAPPPQLFDLATEDFDADENDFFPEMGRSSSLKGWVQHFDITAGDAEATEEDRCSTPELE